MTRRAKKKAASRKKAPAKWPLPKILFAVGTIVSGIGSGSWGRLRNKGTYSYADGQRPLVCARGHRDQFGVHFSTKRGLLVILCNACGGSNQAEIVRVKS